MQSEAARVRASLYHPPRNSCRIILMTAMGPPSWSAASFGKLNNALQPGGTMNEEIVYLSSSPCFAAAAIPCHAIKILENSKRKCSTK